jgi:kynureninase
MQEMQKVPHMSLNSSELLTPYGNESYMFTNTKIAKSCNVKFFHYHSSQHHKTSLSIMVQTVTDFYANCDMCEPQYNTVYITCDGLRRYSCGNIVTIDLSNYDQADECIVFHSSHMSQITSKSMHFTHYFVS